MPETAPDAVEALKVHLAPVVDLRHAAAVLGWDQQTHMPPGGGKARAAHLATLSRITHELFTSPRTGELLEAAERVLDRLDPDSDEAALVRMTRRDYDQATKLPAEFVAERRRAASLPPAAPPRCRAPPPCGPKPRRTSRFREPGPCRLWRTG